jgi:hypothetical protein
MKTLTVRLPDGLAADIGAESRRRRLPKSVIVRERLQRGKLPPELDDIADLIGSIDDDLPADLSARKKHYLRLWGFGRNRSPRVRQQR